MDAEIELWLNKGGAVEAAEQRLVHALEIARRQSALSWELRIATSLARVWHLGRSRSAAQDLVASTLQRFTEGFGTADLMRASGLLAEWGSEGKDVKRSRPKTLPRTKGRRLWLVA